MMMAIFHLDVCVLQCQFRDAADRHALLKLYPSESAARKTNKLTRARDAFKAKGFMPFVRVVFELKRHKALMGGVPLFSRMPGDALHLVRSNIILRNCRLVHKLVIRTRFEGTLYIFGTYYLRFHPNLDCFAFPAVEGRCVQIRLVLAAPIDRKEAW
jgi:hypothetical protein